MRTVRSENAKPNCATRKLILKQACRMIGSCLTLNLLHCLHAGGGPKDVKLEFRMRTVEKELRVPDGHLDTLINVYRMLHSANLPGAIRCVSMEVSHCCPCGMIAHGCLCCTKLHLKTLVCKMNSPLSAMHIGDIKLVFNCFAGHVLTLINLVSILGCSSPVFDLAGMAGGLDTEPLYFSHMFACDSCTSSLLPSKCSPCSISVYL